jgi:hypothetical protein
MKFTFGFVILWVRKGIKWPACHVTLPVTYMVLNQFTIQYFQDKLQIMRITMHTKTLYIKNLNAQERTP